MAVPVVESFTTNTSGGSTVTSLSVNKPASVAVGDLLLIIVGSDDSGSADEFSMSAGGFTKHNEYGSATYDAHIGTFYRVADGTEGSSFTVNAASADEMFIWCLRISGVDTTNPINATGPDDGYTGSLGHTITGTTTTVDDCLALMVFAQDGGDGYPFTVTGTGWTEGDELQSGSGGSDAAGCWGYKSVPSTGATGSAGVVTGVNDGSVAYIFAIAPSSGTAYELTADAGSYALSGTAADLEYGRALDAEAGSYILTGQDATLSKGLILTAEAGSFALSGHDAALEFGYALDAEVGSFSLSGQTAALEFGYALDAEAGSFTVSGQDASLEYGYALDADAGSYTLTGQDATLTYTPVGGYTLVAEAGSYILSGTDATLNLGIALTAEAGSFIISGQDASLEFGYLLDAEPGSFAFTGSDGTLVYSGEVVAEVEPAEVWWPIVLKERKRRQDHERKIAADKIRAARKSAKRKITLHVRRGKPVTESALMKLVEDSVKQVAPKAPADDREDAALDIMIDLAAHIARIADEEDTVALLLA